VAYADVIVNGSGNPSLGLNSGFSSVTEPAPGEFCLTPLYAGHPIIVSGAGTDVSFGVFSPQQCPGGYEIGASESLTSGQGFMVTVP
jgi:hypothetical protein